MNERETQTAVVPRLDRSPETSWTSSLWANADRATGSESRFRATIGELHTLARAYEKRFSYNFLWILGAVLGTRPTGRIVERARFSLRRL